VGTPVTIYTKKSVFRVFMGVTNSNETGVTTVVPFSGSGADNTTLPVRGAYAWRRPRG